MLLLYCWEFCFCEMLKRTFLKAAARVRNSTAGFVLFWCAGRLFAACRNIHNHIQNHAFDAKKQKKQSVSYVFVGNFESFQFSYFSRFCNFSDFRFSIFDFPIFRFFLIAVGFFMPQMTYTKFDSDRSNGAKVKKRD